MTEREKLLKAYHAKWPANKPIIDVGRWRLETARLSEKLEKIGKES